jgi:hypothetical protein
MTSSYKQSLIALAVWTYELVTELPDGPLARDTLTIPDRLTNQMRFQQ